MTVPTSRDSEGDEIAAYRGAGTRGWRVAESDSSLPQELVTLDAGSVFGGEWPERQEWQILEGRGSVSWDPRPARIPVSPGARYRFEPGERRLLRAVTPVRLLITPVT